MSIERLEDMKEAFMCAVEGQMYNLSEVDAEELGEVVDMIKDIEEAIYYCTVTKAMKNENKYYTPMYPDWKDDRMYYGSNGSGHPNGHSGDGTSYYTEKEYPHAYMDKREGKSYRSRRMYMEAKETKQDKTVQMKELEKYMQELAQDIIEMVEGSTSEEKQYMSKKVSALATKLSQLND